MKKNLFIVDDSAFMRMMLKDILKRAEYEIVGEAENGKAAVDLYSQLHPDLTLMDITMPEKNGLQALKEIRALDPDAAVIMMAVQGEENRALMCKLAGAKGSISKPFQQAPVLEAVKKVLR